LKRAGKQRLDERVVAAGLAATRSQAESLIRSGRVLVADTPVDKPGTLVAPDAELRLRGDTSRYVSRGGDKLAGALADLGIEPSGLACLDVGASTGGFTDCLLQAGARRVCAVDVGYGQFALSLRGDPRVHLIERANARELAAEQLPWPVELVVIDVSFISVRLILPAIVRVAPAAALLVLVKPQFEVGRERVGKGGVVRDDALREEAVASVAAAAQVLGYSLRGRADSRVHGPKGNREIFLWLGAPVSAAAACEPKSPG
jgi:23S rRNA (cytidine1920-2'-O)/16S rRNA (cytidine1409-2'-O)-methyltransferase